MQKGLPNEKPRHFYDKRAQKLLEKRPDASNVFIQRKTEKKLTIRQQMFERARRNPALTRKSQCMLCIKGIRDGQLPAIIGKALFRRYCASINYFYTRDINKILSDSPSEAQIHYQELFVYDCRAEWLKKFYSKRVYAEKMASNLQYLEFRLFQPRIHLKGVEKILCKHFMQMEKVMKESLKKKLEEAAQKRNKKVKSKEGVGFYIELDRLKRIEDKSQVVESLNQRNLGNRFLGDLDNDVSYQEMIKKQESQKESLKQVSQDLKKAIGKHFVHNEKEIISHFQENSISRIQNRKGGPKHSISTISQQLKEKVSEICSIDLSRPAQQILFDPQSDQSKSFLIFGQGLFGAESTFKKETPQEEMGSGELREVSFTVKRPESKQGEKEGWKRSLISMEEDRRERIQMKKEEKNLKKTRPIERPMNSPTGTEPQAQSKKNGNTQSRSTTTNQSGDNRDSIGKCQMKIEGDIVNKRRVSKKMDEIPNPNSPSQKTQGNRKEFTISNKKASRIGSRESSLASSKEHPVLSTNYIKTEPDNHQNWENELPIKIQNFIPSQYSQYTSQRIKTQGSIPSEASPESKKPVNWLILKGGNSENEEKRLGSKQRKVETDNKVSLNRQPSGRMIKENQGPTPIQIPINSSLGGVFSSKGSLGGTSGLKLADQQRHGVSMGNPSNAGLRGSFNQNGLGGGSLKYGGTLTRSLTKEILKTDPGIRKSVENLGSGSLTPFQTLDLVKRTRPQSKTIQIQINNHQSSSKQGVNVAQVSIAKPRTNKIQTVITQSNGKNGQVRQVTVGNRQYSHPNIAKMELDRNGRAVPSLKDLHEKYRVALDLASLKASFKKH